MATTEIPSLHNSLDVRPLILVVDDNAQNRALVQTTLEEEGQRVMLASGGDEALQLFEAHLPDCVLLDVRMPGTDGLVVCRAIRARSVGGDTPIVFLTALRDVETFDEALEAGGDDFLTKPVRPTELIVRVQAALKLRRLTSENRGYYETIRSQRDAMMRLQLQKEQLMAFVVHDLKNPVSTLDLHAQLLLRDKSLSASSQESARAIRNEAELLIRQINNLLDLSKSDEAKLTGAAGPVDLRALIADIRHSFEPRAQAKEVSLVTELAPLEVQGDRDLLRRVFENLLDNALRHAPHGTSVTVAATETAERVLVTVADQGLGIPLHMREKVFERFVQAGDASGVNGSYGLGLAFCKLAVEHQGGHISIEDGHPGASFCVSLRHVS
ncbi:MAG: two-component hybrid sensor and regulator [Myxococcaceae bacterium]|nr:two-component hybrid sensor and regulator [Myxococcaceae bacterium]